MNDPNQELDRESFFFIIMLVFSAVFNTIYLRYPSNGDGPERRFTIVPWRMILEDDTAILLLVPIASNLWCSIRICCVSFCHAATQKLVEAFWGDLGCFKIIMMLYLFLIYSWGKHCNSIPKSESGE